MSASDAKEKLLAALAGLLTTDFWVKFIGQIFLGIMQLRTLEWLLGQIGAGKEIQWEVWALCLGILTGQLALAFQAVAGHFGVKREEVRAAAAAESDGRALVSANTRTGTDQQGQTADGAGGTSP